MANQPDPSTGDGKTEKQETTTASERLIQPVATTQTPPVTTTQNAHSEHKREPIKWTDIVMTASTVVMAIATVAIGCLAYRQWVDSGALTTAAQKAATAAQQFQGSAADIQSKIALAQGNMKTMAEIASKSLQTTQGAMRLDQRAWISIINLHLSKELTAGENVGITFTVPNSGKTPAIHVSAKYVIDIKPTEPPIPNWASLKKYNQEVVFPNSNIAAVQATASGITETIINSYTTHTTRLYIRARIDYRDVFGMPHWTEICSSHQFGDSMDSFQGCPIGAEIDPNNKPGKEIKHTNQTSSLSRQLGQAPLDVDHDALVRDRLSRMSPTCVVRTYRVSRPSVIRFVRDAQRRQMFAAA